MDTTNDTGFDPADYARQYRKLGMLVLPATMPSATENGKRPAVEWKKFNSEPLTDDVFDGWYGTTGKYRDRPNMGFVTGPASGGLFVVDIDSHKKPEALDWWKQICRTHVGRDAVRTPTQMTGGGGYQLFFRAPADWQPPTFATTLGVDVRGQGGFAVLPPSMHQSGKPYEWLPGLAPWEVDFLAAPDWLIRELDTLRAPAASDQIPSGDISEDAADDGREAIMARMAWRRVVEEYRFDPTPPTPEVIDYMIRTGFPKYVEAVVPRLTDPNLSKADLLEMEGRGRTAYAAKIRAAVRLWDTKVREAAEKPLPDPGDTPPLSDAASADAGFVAEPYHWTDPSKLPRRPWIYGNLFLRGSLAVIAGTGGVGKTAWTTATALAIATGTPFLGEKIWDGPKKVWLINLEDDPVEITRSIQAAALKHGILPDQIANNVFVNAGVRTGKLKIATTKRGETKINTKLVDWLIEQLKSNRVDVLIIDPLVSFHGVPENDNTAIDMVAKELARVAVSANCAVVAIHHTRKGGDGETDSARGASALTNAARMVLTLSSMSKEDAEKLNIDPEEHRSYVRLNNAKSNRTPLAKAKWLKLESEDLGNGDGDFDGGDSVGVVVCWDLPEIDDSLTDEQIAAIVAVLGTGEHREDPQAEHYAGKAIAAVLGMDMSDKKQRATVKRYTTMLIRNGHLEVYVAKTKGGKTVSFVRSSPRVGKNRASDSDQGQP